MLKDIFKIRDICVSGNTLIHSKLGFILDGLTGETVKDSVYLQELGTLYENNYYVYSLKDLSEGIYVYDSGGVKCLHIVIKDTIYLIDLRVFEGQYVKSKVSDIHSLIKILQLYCREYNIGLDDLYSILGGLFKRIDLCNYGIGVEYFNIDNIKNVLVYIKTKSRVNLNSISATKCYYFWLDINLDIVETNDIILCSRDGNKSKLCWYDKKLKYIYTSYNGNFILGHSLDTLDLSYKDTDINLVVYKKDDIYVYRDLYYNILKKDDLYYCISKRLGDVINITSVYTIDDNTKKVGTKYDYLISLVGAFNTILGIDNTNLHKVKNDEVKVDNNYMLINWETGDLYKFYDIDLASNYFSNVKVTSLQRDRQTLALSKVDVKVDSLIVYDKNLDMYDYHLENKTLTYIGNYKDDSVKEYCEGLRNLMSYMVV